MLVRLLLFLLIFNFGLFSKTTHNEKKIIKIISKQFTESKLSIISKDFNNLWLIQATHKSNDHTDLILVKLVKNKFEIQIIKFEDTVMDVIYARFIKLNYLEENLIEAVAASSKGNGYLYLFDLKLNLKLKTKFYDSHQERIQYYQYKDSKLFKNKSFSEDISQIYRGYRLKAIYYSRPKAMIKIFGICDFILESNKIVYSEKIEKYYEYSKVKNKFIYFKKISKEETNWCCN